MYRSGQGQRNNRGLMPSVALGSRIREPKCCFFELSQGIACYDDPILVSKKNLVQFEGAAVVTDEISD